MASVPQPCARYSFLMIYASYLIPYPRDEWCPALESEDPPFESYLPDNHRFLPVLFFYRTFDFNYGYYE